jgi:S-layer protein (TIGR01567 family)
MTLNAENKSKRSVNKSAKILNVAAILALIMLLIPSLILAAGAAIQTSKVEIHGNVADAGTEPSLIPLWNAKSFGAFYYDLKNDRQTESLKLTKTLGNFAISRLIDKDVLWYNTTKARVDFKVYEKSGINVDNDTQYQIVGWQGEKWIATNGAANKLTKLVLEMGKEDTKTMKKDETWSLGSGYEITINAINTNITPGQINFSLKQDGTLIDEAIVQAPASLSNIDKQKAVYFKKLTILGESNALLFTIYVEQVFKSSSEDFVQFKYAWLIDKDSAVEIKSGDNYGVFQVRTANPDNIALSNENTISLYKNTEPILMGNLKFRVADDTSLRFYPLVEYTAPGIYELRGNVVSDEDGSLIPSWDGRTFGAFYHDLKNSRQPESLKFTKALSRSMGGGELEYKTIRSPVEFKVHEKENVTVNSKLIYSLVGWQAEKWIGINDKAYKLAKLAFEMGIDDKKTLTTGETWSLGAGYELTINAIDARTSPRQVWFTLKNNGTIIDEGTGQAPQSYSVADKQKAVYFKTRTIQGESDALLFTIYVDTIFSGATSDMVQFKYAWLIDESSAKEIRAADRIGVFEVRTADYDEIMMTNLDSINLSSNTETTLMGEIKFKVADHSNVLRFYPKIDYIIGGGGIPTTGPVHNINKGTNYSTIQAAINDASPGDEIRVDSGIYYENVNVTKRLTLRGIGMPVVNASGSGSAITLAADRIVLEGFTAIGGGLYPNAGIKVISNNNKLSSNNANSNNYNGIVLDRSNNNTLIGNNANSNKQNGISLFSSINDTLSGNSVWNNSYGIVLGSSSSNMLFGNTADSNKGYGIILDGSSNNTLIGNNASNNFDGIFVELSINNKIYHNNLINNTNQARDSTNANSWHFGYPSGGNYWSDYTGVDLNSGPSQNIAGSDGIGDTPYNIGGGGAQDGYPLMKPWGITPTSGPVHNINKGTNYATIQGAINDASPGDEIRVDSGTYYENVNVTKRLTLRGIGMPVINSTYPTVELSTDGITFEEFAVEGSIRLYNINNCNLNYNSVMNGATTIGITLLSSNNNTLNGNIVKWSRQGAVSPHESAIIIKFSTGNSLSNNIVTGNAYGIKIDRGNNNSLTGNNVSNNLHGVVLSGSNGNTLSGNLVEHNSWSGVSLSNSTSNLLNGNNVSDDDIGIQFTLSSNNNTLFGNNLKSNNVGIFIESSNNNKIYHNNLINNTNQATDNTDANSWNSTYPSGGNNWSDYTGVDLNSGPIQNIPGSDGIGDTPYLIPGGSSVDRYPLMMPYTGEPTPPSIAVGQGAPDLATKNHFIDAYNRNGGINVMGNPATEVHRAWGFLVQDFPGASGYGGGIIIYNPYKYYAYYIHSEIWQRYYSVGGPKAKTDLSFELGPPTSDIEPYVHLLPPENSKYGTPFRYQKFEGGNLELNVTSGSVFEVHGGILQKWRELGYAASNLGLPTTDEREAAVSPSGLTGRYSVFEGGIIHWIRERNEIFVIGLNQPGSKKIADKYYAEGGSGGWLGFPVSDDYVNVTSGYLQVNFEGGYITTTDSTNYVAYPKEISSGPTIKINYPPNDFHTDKQRITLAGIADSDAPIMRIDARITPVNGNPYYYSKIPYGPTSNEWNTNVGLKYGLNIIDVSVADGNFDNSIDSINVYYDEPDFSFVHLTDVHIGDISLPVSSIKESRITEVLNQVNNEIPKPDFILISGDLVDYSNDEYFWDFNDIFSDVKAYIVPGNHDRRISPFDGNDNLVNYLKNIGLARYPNLHYIDDIYHFEEKGYQFIGLDSGSDYDYASIDPYMDDFSPEGTGLTDTQLSGLKEFDKTTPKIIFMHNPAIDDSDDELPSHCDKLGILCKFPLISNTNYGGNDGTIANNREIFIDYTTEFNVQLVLSGHTHENYISNSHGTKVNELSDERPLFIQTGSGIVDNEYKDESGLSFSKLPPLYGYRIIDIRDGKAYPRQFTPIEFISAPNTDLTPFESTDRSKLTLKLLCPANLNVYDSQGRHTGLNSSGGIETNIPDSFYIGRHNASDSDEAETIFIYNATEEYRFEIIANLTEEQKNSPENESFNFTMDRQSEGIQTIESFQNITLNENTTAILQVNITTENPKMSLDYNGDTLTDETKDPNSIETNYAPTAAIISPEIGSIYNQSEIVEFNGTGKDPEDGILTNTSLVWYSDIDGFIGSGERFSTVNLSAGSHIITLMVNDSMYLYGASSITITIADTEPPVTTLIPSGTLGNNSWFISDVNVTLTATDTQTGSGVNITEYSFDNSTWTTYIDPFNITSEGTTTVYYRSSDNASNIESTRNQTIKIDKTLPAAIINPQAIAGSTWLNFTWTNPLNPDFHHVMLYLNGTFKTSILSPQNYYNFTGLDPDTLYELGTHTVDSSGNVNETWVNATGRTLSSSGTANPIVSNPTASHEIPDDTDNEPLWGETAQLNVTVTDDSGVASVTVNLSEIGGLAVKPMTNIGGNIWSTTTNASAGTSPKIYNLTVNATDTLGNSNTSVTIPLRVMKNGDTTGNGLVTIGDALRCANNVSYPGNPTYVLSSPYVADVNGNGVINIGDCLRLANNVSFSGNPLYILK